MALRGARLTDRTRVVAMAKLVLPLIALGLLSMVFLLADTVDPERALETADIDVEDRARDPRLSAARFAGVTDEGAALRIEAGEARSDPGATLRFQVRDFTLRLDRDTGGHFEAHSDSGLIDRGRGEFRMEGAIRIRATPGYDLTAPRIAGLLDRSLIRVEGPVTGRAPVGEVFAGSLTLTAAPAEGQAGAPRHRLVFRESVRMIYRPED